MINKIKAVLKTSLMLFAGTVTLLSCESEADNLGSQFFDGADGTVKTYPVIAYNVDNGDKIQSDGSRLTNAVIGAFTEGQFGTQKAAYVTQVRLGSYSPDFGTNAVLDSVVLVLKPLYATDSATVNTDSKYNYPVGNVASTKVFTTYPVTGYGHTKRPVTLNVHEVKEFLGTTTDTIYSDRKVQTGALIGEKVFNGKVSSVKITGNSDNAQLVSLDAGIRIPLDKAFFQSKILAKSKSAELSDAANFIRYFNGIRISVAENDGFMFSITPNNSQLIMYFKRDVTTNGTTTSTPDTFTFDLGSSNVHFTQVDHLRTNAAVASAQYNTTGSTRLYAQGMGGPGIGIKIPSETVAQIKDLYKNQNVAVISAKIKLFTDESVWNNNYSKPSYFTVKQKDSTGFLPEVSAMIGNPAFSLVKGTDLAKNPAYYEISITQTFKNMIEKEAGNSDFILNVGQYESGVNGNLLGQNYNTRAYTPNRVVLVGTDESKPKTRAQLNIIYTKKQ